MLKRIMPHSEIDRRFPGVLECLVQEGFVDMAEHANRWLALGKSADLIEQRWPGLLAAFEADGRLNWERALTPRPAWLEGDDDGQEADGGGAGGDDGGGASAQAGDAASAGADGQDDQLASGEEDDPGDGEATASGGTASPAPGESGLSADVIEAIVREAQEQPRGKKVAFALERGVTKQEYHRVVREAAAGRAE